MTPAWTFRSALPGLAWPAVPAQDKTAVLALLFQLEASQWLPPDTLRALQQRQLEVLLRHAYETVPFYRNRWGTAPRSVDGLAPLRRVDLQEHFAELRSVNVPPAHGQIGESRTSGSTGAPVRVLRTELSRAYWNAITLRDHLWHRRDLRAKLAGIRATSQPGAFENWGFATHDLVETGPAVLSDARSDISGLLRWLEREKPDYLLTYPSVLRELLALAKGQGVRAPGLREVRTFAEMLPAELRELCREAWGVPIVDMYSAEEAGYIALQCPSGEHYHAQSESLLVEVLDEHGRPCAPGEVGRVVVTTLQEFAMPLVRYQIGDYAVLGAPCACGRGLPVIERIMGRVNNLLIAPDGRRYWPIFGMRKVEDLPIRQHQFVQKRLDLLEARLVTAAPFSAEQEARFRAHVQAALPAGMRLEVRYVEHIPRSAGGKYEDLISEVAS